MNKTKDEFLKKVKYILSEDAYAVEILSTLEQNIMDSKYEEFMNYIHSTHYEVEFMRNDEFDMSSMGDIVVSIFSVLHNKLITYILRFNLKYEYLGFCKCKYDDPGYNIHHKCCGVNCDWEVPVMTVIKEETLGVSEFNGNKKDLWKYEDTYKGDVKTDRMIEIANQIKHLSEEYTYLKNGFDEEDFDN